MCHMWPQVEAQYCSRLCTRRIPAAAGVELVSAVGRRGTLLLQPPGGCRAAPSRLKEPSGPRTPVSRWEAVHVRRRKRDWRRMRHDRTRWNRATGEGWRERPEGRVLVCAGQGARLPEPAEGRVRQHGPAADILFIRVRHRHARRAAREAVDGVERGAPRPGHHG